MSAVDFVNRHREQTTVLAEPASGPTPFDPALRSDVVENRALRLVFSDPRSSVRCAAVTLRPRFALSRQSRRRQSRLSNDAGPEPGGQVL
jgi:hypothetical protein